MSRKSLNQTGFSVVEGLLIVIIVLLVGFIGYYVYHTQHQTTAIDNAATKVAQSSPAKVIKKTTAQTTSADPYAGWQSYTTKEFGISFEYPASWKLDDSNNSSADDMVNLTTSNGFVVNVDAISDSHPGSDVPESILFNKTVTYSEHSAYLDFYSENSASNVAGAVLSTAITGSPLSNVPQYGISPTYNLLVDARTPAPESITAAQADQNYADVVLLVQSLKIPN